MTYDARKCECGHDRGDHMELNTCYVCMVESREPVCQSWRPLPRTSNANERFEELAAEFYRETGLMAPGKDVAPAMGPSDETERYAKWDEWRKAKRLAQDEIDRELNGESAA